MTFYDTHMHSHLSFDAEENPRAYFDSSTKRITFTDHLDLENTVFNKRDDIPDFETLIHWQQEFKEKDGIDLLLGVEVGYVPGQEARLNEILSSYPFDLKLLSCHQNDRYDYMDKDTGDAPEVMMANYVKQLYEAVSTMTDCQIMTHFDYGFRVHQVSVTDLKPYEEQLIQIFEKCIENNFAFELNGKSIAKYNTLDLYEWAVPLYIELGGTLFSLGSDAHNAAEHYLAFDQMVGLLEKHGVTEVAQYKEQELYLVSLEEVKNRYLQKYENKIK